MGKGFVRSQSNQLFEKILRHGRVAQFPVGMGEIEMDGWATGIQRRCFLKRIDRGGSPAGFLELYAEVIP
jgi:hypothetical protein